MGDNAIRPTRRPVLLWLSVAATASILPLLWLLERFSGPCADGLCTFLPGVAIVAACLVVALTFAVVGLRRGERPRWILMLSLPALAGVWTKLAGCSCCLAAAPATAADRG